MKKALVIGIDNYQVKPLSGCVNDAITMGSMLEKNGDGSPNFNQRSITSNNQTITSDVMITAISELFSGDADVAMLFFAGHGIISKETNSGYLVSQNGTRGSWGVSLSEILDLANRAYPKIKSSVIVLDCCHSGFAGELSGIATQSLSVIGTGVTILTACQRTEAAGELNGHGIFTALLLDGLGGSSSDICGRITPASLYSLVDQTLGPWEQRPIYKANVQTFTTLRTVTPRVSFDVLRKLPVYFPDAGSVFKLDPSFEPDRENVPLEFRSLPENKLNQAIFKELQTCNRNGLVVPVDAEHMYYAAINSTGCRLTSLGAHYRNLAIAKRI